MSYGGYKMKIKKIGLSVLLATLLSQTSCGQIENATGYELKDTKITAKITDKQNKNYEFLSSGIDVPKGAEINNAVAIEKKDRKSVV